MTRIVCFGVLAALMVAILLLGAAPVSAQTAVGLSFFDGELVDVDPDTGLCSNPRVLRYGTEVIRYHAGLAQHPGSGTVYMLTTYGSFLGACVFDVDIATGAATPVVFPSLTEVFEGDLDFDPTSGELFALQDGGPTWTETNLFTIDLTTGTATVIADLEPALGGDRDYSAMAFDSAGRLWVVNTALDELVRFDPVTGGVISKVELTVPGSPSHTLGNCAAMDFDLGTGQLYLADGCDAGTDILYTVDLATGVLTDVGPTFLTSGLCGMRFLSSALIFSDGFESGSTINWSGTMP